MTHFTILLNLLAIILSTIIVQYTNLSLTIFRRYNTSKNMVSIL